MTFTFENKPVPSDILSNSQADIRNNYQYLQACLDKDHQINFGSTNTTTFEGRHTQVSLSNRADPNLSLPGDGTDGFLYSSVGNLFWRGAASTSAMQLTGQNPVNSANGKSFLAGGLLIQWGSVASAGGSGTISFTTAFGSAAYAVTLGYNRASTSSPHTVYVTSVAAGSFNYASDSASITNLYWIAIGPS